MNKQLVYAGLPRFHSFILRTLSHFGKLMGYLNDKLLLTSYLFTMHDYKLHVVIYDVSDDFFSEIIKPWVLNWRENTMHQGWEYSKPLPTFFSDVPGRVLMTFPLSCAESNAMYCVDGDMREMAVLGEQLFVKAFSTEVEECVL